MTDPEHDIAEGAPHGPRPVQPGERWFLLALTVFSALALWQSYGISGFTSASGPGVFPMLAAATMLATALGLTLARLARAGAGPRGLAGLAWIVPPRTGLFLVFVLGFVLLVPRLGFMVAAGLFLFASIAVNWRRGVPASAAVTAVVLLLVWLVFRVAFQVVLPSGTLWTSVF
ncbi:tripartite tricarboxylate transporter TctB family protein [Acuticoccus sediminis]|uniref:Tripartite tricarboxylate transporter TctB family protein n=1 Tax=Acuticoccus sediminis TaxID=2184697 RepID=A0A8B2NMB4_9HYPH|nr:tripartite tricarboxylate transporter TctB family protein [Acuticoccus sediminis]RAH96519.1 tripartite tricarboxylate transporter TctB family protein [Acuticoccus sediminis]